MVMDLQQSGISSGAKTPGICPHTQNTPLHTHYGQSTAGQIGAGGDHRTQPIPGREASQLSQSPSASCSRQLWKQLCSKLADCPRAELSLLQPRSCWGPACSPCAAQVRVGTSQVKFSSRVYNIYAHGGIVDKYPVTQLCRVHSSPTGAAAVSCQSPQSPREMTP